MTAHARRLWRLLALVPHLILSAAIAFYLEVRRRRGKENYRVVGPIVQWWFRRCLHILHVRVKRQGSIASGPLLLVANHVSYLDILAIGSLVEVRFLAKAEVRDWPLFGWFAAVGMTLFLTRESGRKSRDMVVAITEILQQGQIVGIFPEGTTTTGETVQVFYPSLFEGAVRAAIPVQTVTIRYPACSGRTKLNPVAPFVGNDGLVDHLWRVLAEQAIEVELIFGEVIPPGATRKELADQTWEQIYSVLTQYTLEEETK